MALDLCDIDTIICESGSLARGEPAWRQAVLILLASTAKTLLGSTEFNGTDLVAANSTNEELAPAVAGKSVVLTGLFAFVDGATATQFTLGTRPAGGPTVDFPPIPNLGNAGEVLGYNKAGWLTCGVNEALVVKTGAGSSTSFFYSYKYV